jgi:hypothetical protein
VPARVPERQFDIVLRITEIKNDSRKTLSEPRLRTREGAWASFRDGEEHSIHHNDKIVVLPVGLTIKVAVSSGPKGHLDIDVIVSRETATVSDVFTGAIMSSESARVIREIELRQPVSVELKSKEKDGATIEVIAIVSEPPVKKTLESAEKDFNTADFYRRSKKLGSALFMYKLILRRYPGTLYATEAEKLIAELSELAMPPLAKNASCVGEIRIINNTKTKDSVILENLRLYPGAAFTSQDLRKAEEALYKHVVFSTPGKITIVSEDSDSDYKNILVTVKE